MHERFCPKSQPGTAGSTTPAARRNTQHAAPEDRPTKEHYDRYIWLVENFRALNWDNTKLHDVSLVRIVDPGFNATLIRSAADLAETLGEAELAAEKPTLAARRIAAMEILWSDEHGQYLCRDRVTDALVDCRSVDGLLAAFAPIPANRTARIAETIKGHGTRFRVASHTPDVPRFQIKRYWCGPVWLVVNYMIADGLAQAGITDRPGRSRKPRWILSGFRGSRIPTLPTLESHWAADASLGRRPWC